MLQCWLAWIGAHDAAVTAIATAVIALFTIALVLVSWLQSRLIGKQIKLARDEFNTTARAFVFIESITPTISLYSDDPSHRENPLPQIHRPDLFVTYFALQAKWKNAGNTPTRKMKIRFNRRFFENGMPPDFDIASALPDLGERNFFLGPHAVEGGEVITTNPTQVNALINQGMPIFDSDPSIFVFGRATYEDIFGEPHFVEWCYKVRLWSGAREDGLPGRLQATFIQYGPYNRTDHDG